MAATKEVKAPPSMEAKMATIMRLLASMTAEERVRAVSALASLYVGGGKGNG